MATRLMGKLVLVVFVTVLVCSTDAWAQTYPKSEGSPFLPIHGPYLKAVKSALVKTWKKRHSFPVHSMCPVSISQLEGGKVMDVTISPRCMLDEVDVSALKASVLSTVLPYEGHEPWFWPTIVVDLRPWELGMEAAHTDAPVRIDPISRDRFNPPMPAMVKPEGALTLLLRISPDGVAEEFYIEKSSGNAELDQQGKYLAFNFSYFPEVRDGKRTASTVRLPIIFDHARNAGSSD